MNDVTNSLAEEQQSTGLQGAGDGLHALEGVLGEVLGHNTGAEQPLGFACQRALDPEVPAGCFQPRLVPQASCREAGRLSTASLPPTFGTDCLSPFAGDDGVVPQAGSLREGVAGVLPAAAGDGAEEHHNHRVSGGSQAPDPAGYQSGKALGAGGPSQPSGPVGESWGSMS